MNTPLPVRFPAQSGAITGHVMTDDEILEMDLRILRRRIPVLIPVTLPSITLH